MAVWREGMTGPLGDKADLRPAEARSRILLRPLPSAFAVAKLGENPRALTVMDLAENCRSPGKRFAGPTLTPGRVLVSFWPSFRCALWRALCAFFSPLGMALVVFCDPEHRFLGRYVAH